MYAGHQNPEQQMTENAYLLLCNLLSPPLQNHPPLSSTVYNIKEIITINLRICFCFFADIKNREDIAKRKRKVKNDGSIFFIFWIRSNIVRDFLGCRRSILISEMVNRFVFPLAFQCRIRNYSTAKTREDIAKRKRKTMVRFTV